MKCRGVSAVIAPAAETKTLHVLPHASAGPCVRKSKCIGDARSEAACTVAGNDKNSGAKPSAIANERNWLILPLSRHLALSFRVVLHVLGGPKRRLNTPGRRFSLNAVARFGSSVKKSLSHLKSK